MAGWNPWHGCRKYSEGCAHCYVYRMDAAHGRDSTLIQKNRDFDLPIRRHRDGSPVIPSGETVFCCFSSDFFLEEADEWRRDAWRFIRERQDLRFFIVTKRILRFSDVMPDDWGSGYENLILCTTCENQKRADERLSVFLSLPIPHRQIICEPLLGPVDLSPYLAAGGIEAVTVGGESGPDARPCRYEWVTALHEQCRAAGVSFSFKQTGANFIKDGRMFRVKRRFQHAQAKKAGLDFRIRRPSEAGKAAPTPSGQISFFDRKSL